MNGSTGIEKSLELVLAPPNPVEISLSGCAGETVFLILDSLKDRRPKVEQKTKPKDREKQAINGGEVRKAGFSTAATPIGHRSFGVKK